jgi:phosphoglycerate kinase
MQLLKNAKINGKRVFLRLDLDVPLVDGKIDDDTRLISAIPTIEYLLKQNAKVIIAGHLGRPKGIDKNLSLEPVADWFASKLKIGNWKLKITTLSGFMGWEIGPNVFLLENLRFYEGEEKNDLEFSKKLASLAQVYVNDAFAMCHRSHASVVGITHFLPHFAGLHLEKEFTNLTQAIKNPKRPLVVIIGGKKIETKLPLVEKMHRIADYVLVGGKIADETRILVKVQHEKILGPKAVLLVADLTPDGLDITEKDAENFLQVINLAKTVIWNGSMGVTSQKSKVKSQKSDTEKGTRLIAQGIIKSGAYAIAGGGDTVEYLNKLKIADKFSFVSTGGGAMLSLLSGEKLPGLVALEKS